MSKLIFSYVKILCVFLLILCSVPSLADERILSFDSRIQVNLNGTLTITEIIQVRHEGKQIRRGVFRDLPTANGARYQLLGVKRNNNVESSFVEYPNGFYRINTGDDSFLPNPGVSIFEITYMAKNTGLGRFQGYDEVYWNVTGDKWAFPIDKTSARVILPDGVSEIQQAGYVGVKGSQESAAYHGNGYFEGRALNRGEQLTIALGFTPGVVDIKQINPVFSIKDAPSLIETSGSLKNAVLIVFIMLVYFAVVWHYYGRDPSRRAVMPEFKAPDGLTAAQCCLLKNGGAPQSKVALIHFVQMLSNGFISIASETEKVLWWESTTYTINPTGKMPINSEEEQFITSYPSGLILRDKFSPKLHQYVKKLSETITQTMKSYYETNIKWILIGYGLLVVVTALLGGKQGALAALLLLFLIPFLWEMFKINSPLGRFGLIVILWMSAFIITIVPIQEAIAVLGCILVLFPLFKNLLFQPTEIGARSMEQLNGLKMFLKAVGVKTPIGFTAKDMEAL